MSKGKGYQLHDAVSKNGDIRRVQELLRTSGINVVNAKADGTNKSTELHVARKDTRRLSDCCWNIREWTSIVKIFMEGHHFIVHEENGDETTKPFCQITLVEKGADINAKDNDGKTSLHQACQELHDKVVRFLLK